MGLFRRTKKAEVELPPPEDRKVSAPVEAPVQTLFGFQAVGSHKDVEAIAKERCVSKMAKEISWYAVAPFAGGYMYECHEGGGGVAYLPEVIRELSLNMAAGEVFVPSGERLFKIAMRDGHPVCLKLSEGETKLALTRQTTILPKPTGRMKPAVKSGEGFFQVGMAVMAFGTIALFASIGYYFVATSTEQIGKTVAYEQLPHRQWDSIKRLRSDQYVSRLRYADGRWQIDFADNPRPAQPVVPPRPLSPPQIQPNIQPQPQVQTAPAPPVQGIAPASAPAALPAAGVGGVR